MYRKDFIEREFEKLGILLALILRLKKERKPLSEIEAATIKGLKDIFGLDFETEESRIEKLSPQKQQALADILFELGITAHQQEKKEAANRFLHQYLQLLRIIEISSDTFSFQNLQHKAIAEKLIQH